ncbi:MAG TPA: glycosyltransferase family 4 protein [Desulfobacteraceae bacterium]|nr:glycosyltransferase family 4 protein [Desulfobacteraceae bacterium]HPJ66357.1 glycosyltransferase family 4 protein [Desulfobacteraceae bacterium]HPQ27201.1 glycosyltransferase family 4 protein [Desulfobacteraceae bacterium]
MKIFVTGTRGIPDIPGGVEKHCQEIFPRIAAQGHEVLLCTRSPYVARRIGEWRNIRLINCYAPRIKSLEAIVHTLVSLVKARLHSPDIVHIHAIGPSILTPLARIMGLKVVVTNHGPDYDREKWGKLAKWVLRSAEKIGGIYANEVIAISTVISDIIKRRCHRDAHLIHNGVDLPNKSKGFEFLDQIGVKPGGYALGVARFVPEKGLHDLINAFKRIKGDYQLVIAGDADHETDYSRNLRQIAAQDDRIVLTGYVTGEPLNQIYSHASLFVLPSYHEGLPIALLEAMSYGLPVLVSDIPANKEVDLPAERYFRCGDVDDLKDKIKILLEQKLTKEEQQYIRDEIEDKYNWDRIAEQTIEVYRKAHKG